MNWDRFFAPYKAWRERGEQWIAEQPEAMDIVPCVDFFNSYAGEDRMTDWVAQCRENTRIRDELLQRYALEVEPMPNVECTVVLN